MKILFTSLLLIAILSFGCKTMNKTQKGAVIGTASGGVVGAVIGKATGNTVLGAIIGATVGGVTGAVIGRKMDKQAEEIKKDIPDAEVVRVGEGIVIEFNNKILFGFDQSNLSTEARVNLDKLVSILQKYPDTNIEIQGHTDSKGTVNYNQQLSERRALSVASYLSGYGISPSRVVIAAARLTTIGYGEKLPKYTNTTADGQMQNRRVEFLVSANEKMKADAASEANNSGK
ncbi:MAG: OmpA family protein [Chitinophagaceae bacterium]|jgi:outer membrane protein OmpA-like peptidoglycan-associated protein|nr:OmpA family protein [Chitinophagaceae bacterium]